MDNIPSSIQLPAAIPTHDQALAGFHSQLGIQLNQWILQAATAINAATNSIDNSTSSLMIGDWVIQENESSGSLVLTYTLPPGGTITIPNPTGVDRIVTVTP